MAAILVYRTVSFLTVFPYALYHLMSATRHHHLRQPPLPSKPYHPLPLSPHRPHAVRHLPLYFLSLIIILSALHSFLSASSSPLHRLAALQTSVSLLLFLPLPFPLLPSDLTFLLASLAFAVFSSSTLHSAAAFSPSDLQSHALSLSALVSAASSLSSLALAASPSLFPAEFSLSLSVALHPAWGLASALLLHVEGLVPEGCHVLLDLPDGYTRCDLDESRVRALAVLDLAFVLCLAIVAAVTVGVYLFAVKSSCSGANGRRVGTAAYEPLPVSSNVNQAVDHVQMKAIGKSAMQA